MTSQPVSGARLLGTSTNGSGEFEVTGEGIRFSQRVTIEADGYVPRETTLSAATAQPTFDLIPLNGFSFDVYKQVVRNTTETPSAPEFLRRLSTNPKIYINTLGPNGRPVDANESLAIVREWLVRGVSLWSDGRLSVEVIEEGAGARPEQPGWINVDFLNTEPTVCGRGRIAGNPGFITLHNDFCACGSTKISPAVVLHEVGHAMGFWHAADRSAVMFRQAPGHCAPPVLSPSEQASARVAYRRPPGNRDPDIDPFGQAFSAGFRDLIVDN